MEIKAQLNHFRMSPRKVRLVANLIRGMDVKRAELELDNFSKRAAGPLLKLLRSAFTSALHNFQIDPKDLFIKSIRVNEGPVFTRFRPRAFGRASPVRKRTSHVLLVLDAKDKIDQRVFPQGQGKKDISIIREASAEDLERSEAFLRYRTKSGVAAKPKSPGFTRRIFRRKAI